MIEESTGVVETAPAPSDAALKHVSADIPRAAPNAPRERDREPVNSLMTGDDSTHL